MAETIIRTQGVDICTQAFGRPGDPPILLVMGASASMLWWDEAFCERLASAGRFVVRYDNRDTGRSTTAAPGQLSFGIGDMARDALGVLDAYGLAAAHLIGMSLGGMIAQIVAFEHPERVLSLTLIASSPFGTDAPELPPMGETFLAYHAGASSVDWSDPRAAVEFMVGGWRLVSGPGRAFEEGAARRLAEQEVARATNLASMFNHAKLDGSDVPGVVVGRIGTPALVIHGTADPILPYEHGQALARLLPDSRLIPLAGAGHELHREDWETIIDAVVQHTEAQASGQKPRLDRRHDGAAPALGQDEQAT